ncbi:hypothetical protein BC829DRAFT_432174 [Chytridium lagenaria]|nr:hypothetical protein BC829DRAFT_432174 [Chytridium lagenaria]
MPEMPSSPVPPPPPPPEEVSEAIVEEQEDIPPPPPPPLAQDRMGQRNMCRNTMFRTRFHRSLPMRRHLSRHLYLSPKIDGEEGETKCEEFGSGEGFGEVGGTEGKGFGGSCWEGEDDGVGDFEVVDDEWNLILADAEEEIIRHRSLLPKPLSVSEPTRRHKPNTTLCPPLQRPLRIPKTAHPSPAPRHPSLRPPPHSTTLNKRHPDPNTTTTTTLPDPLEMLLKSRNEEEAEMALMSPDDDFDALGLIDEFFGDDVGKPWKMLRLWNFRHLVLRRRLWGRWRLWLKLWRRW